MNKQKKSFLLIEILIALSILTALTGFLIYSPVSFLKQEKKQLEDMAKEKLYLKTLEKIRLQIFKNQINLQFNSSSKKVQSLKDEYIFLKGFKPILCKRFFTLSFDPKKMKLGLLGQTFNLAKMEIVLLTESDLEKKYLKNKKVLLQKNSPYKKEALFFIQQLPQAENQNKQNLNL